MRFMDRLHVSYQLSILRQKRLPALDMVVQRARAVMHGPQPGILSSQALPIWEVTLLDASGVKAPGVDDQVMDGRCFTPVDVVS